MVAENFLILLTAHLLADFVFQTESMAVRKNTSWKILLLHSVIVAATTVLVAGGFMARHWLAALAVGVSHGIIDGLKRYLTFIPPRHLFWMDQVAHLAVLLGIAALAPSLGIYSFWTQLSGNFRSYQEALKTISALILTVQVGASVVGYMLQPYAQSAGIDTRPGIPNAGRFIGKLERLFIFLLVTYEEPVGLGLLIFAKSLLRFGSVSDRKSRLMAEYVIIGTLLSFLWAAVVGALFLSVKGITLRAN